MVLPRVLVYLLSRYIVHSRRAQPLINDLFFPWNVKEINHDIETCNEDEEARPPSVAVGLKLERQENEVTLWMWWELREKKVVNLVEKKQGASLLNKISSVVIILFLSKENNTGDTWLRTSKLCVLPSLRCYQRKGTLAMKVVMLSPFPQELTALISWEKVHKGKKCHSIFFRAGKTSHGAGTIALNTNHTLLLTAVQNWKDILRTQGHRNYCVHDAMLSKAQQTGDPEINNISYE